ncbi:MAG: hypothetical protein ACLQPH_14820 [Acidimicrobiales bacterium]
MPDVIDGGYDTPEGRRKLFVSQRPDESDDAFTTRMMAFMLAMENGQTLDVVLASGPADWEVLPSDRWVEARNRTHSKLRLRVTANGGSLGHLVVESGDEQIADAWGDLLDDGVYLPRAEDGRIITWQAALWSLAHQIRGLARSTMPASSKVGWPWSDYPSVPYRHVTYAIPRDRPAKDLRPEPGVIAR